MTRASLAEAVAALGPDDKVLVLVPPDQAATRRAGIVDELMSVGVDRWGGWALVGDRPDSELSELAAVVSTLAATGRCSAALVVVTEGVDRAAVVRARAEAERAGFDLGVLDP